MSRADDNRSESHELLSEPLLTTADAGPLLDIPRSRYTTVPSVSLFCVLFRRSRCSAWSAS